MKTGTGEARESFPTGLIKAVPLHELEHDPNYLIQLTAKV